jgi:outer membrane protein
MKVRSMKLLPALLLSVASLAATAQDLKVGYVNSERVLREAEPAKQAQRRLDQEFGKREKDLNDQLAALQAAADKLDKEAPALSDTEKVRRQRELVDQDRDLQRKKREFQEDLTTRRNEAVSSISERANRVIKQIGDSEKYDVILADQPVIYFSNRVDITKKVIEALNAGK